MTFAKWENEIRTFDPFVVIYTQCADNGEVTLAWCGSHVWIKPE